LFPGFRSGTVEVDGSAVFARWGGSGPAVLLLHGFPETHLMWRDVAPRLAGSHTVVCADLRGYGRSGCPPSTVDHAPYTKRAMATELVGLMDRLGHRRFAVVGHDRGARVGHRLALDHPERVAGLAVLDVVPTAEMRAGHWPCGGDGRRGSRGGGRWTAGTSSRRSTRPTPPPPSPPSSRM
jgi:haloacetate dehalogenase